MSQEWGSISTDYIAKLCKGCHIRCPDHGDVYNYFGTICRADADIKYYYTHGRTQDAIDLLRCLPTDALKDYLPEERRTPTELKAVILDELQAREKEDTPRL